MAKAPAKKITEVEALLAIAKAINRLAVAAETIASPPQPEPKEDGHEQAADHHND
jgi:hypothetical protein